jgi:hypothetical protein
MMENRKEDRSLGELFSELATETSTLIRQEMQLARVELGQTASQAGKEVGFIGLGGAVTYAGVLAVIAAVILIIGQFMPMWLSALIVGVVVAAIGYFLSQKHLNALKDINVSPRATLETLKQDKDWAKEQMR